MIKPNQPITFIFLMIVIFTSCGLPEDKANDIVYYDSSLVYDSFKMKMEMSKKLDDKLNNQKEQLKLLQNKVLTYNQDNRDSLEYYTTEVSKLKNLYRATEFERARSLNLVKKRLAVYVQMFFKNNNYLMILDTSSENNGVVLYGNHNYDITEDLKIFVNQKYEGEN